MRTLVGQRLMEQVGPNFHKDQNGMHSQLQSLHRICKVPRPCSARRPEAFILPAPRALSLSPPSVCAMVAGPDIAGRAGQVLEPTLLLFLEEKDCAHFYFCFRWLLILFKVLRPIPMVHTVQRCVHAICTSRAHSRRFLG